MIRLIVAYDQQRGIAKHGRQPWSIPDDEAYFTQTTKSCGATILVGSTTFKTFKKPLTDRNNFVVTSDKRPISGATAVHALPVFLKSYASKDLWVIGGAAIYQQVMMAGYADEIYVTQIAADFSCDQFFPTINHDYQLLSQSDQLTQNGWDFRYQIYGRRSAVLLLENS